MPRGTRRRYFKRKNTRTRQKIRKQRRTKKSGNTRKRKQRRTRRRRRGDEEETTRRRRRGGDDEEEPPGPPDPSEEQVMANRKRNLRSWTSYWNNDAYYWLSIPSTGKLSKWFPLTDSNRDGRDELALDADYVDEVDRRKFLEELTPRQRNWAKYRILPGEAAKVLREAARLQRAVDLAANGVQRTKSGIKYLLPLHVAYPLNPLIAIPADQSPPRAAAAMSVQGQWRWVPDLSEAVQMAEGGGGVAEAVQMAEGGGGVAEAVPGPVLSAAGVRRLQKD